VQARVRHAARAQHWQQRLRAHGKEAGQRMRSGKTAMRNAGRSALPTPVKDRPAGRRAAAARQCSRRRPKRQPMSAG